MSCRYALVGTVAVPILGDLPGAGDEPCDHPEAMKEVPELPELEEEAEKVTAEEAISIVVSPRKGRLPNPRRPCTSRTSRLLKRRRTGLMAPSSRPCRRCVQDSNRWGSRFSVSIAIVRDHFWPGQFNAGAKLEASYNP